jgi:hypothetical protein
MPLSDAHWPLYKYQTIDTLSLGNLAKRKVWLASPKTLNDPFEFRLQRNGAPRGTQQLLRQHPRRGTNSEEILVVEAVTEFQKQLDRFGIACFTQSPDNIQMWSHYGDQHRGMCLGFAGSTPLDPGSLHCVRYSEIYPEMTFDPLWHIEGLGRILVTKHAGWSYEREVRMINVEGARLVDYPAPLTLVIFGFRTTPSDQHLVRTLVGPEAGVQFLRIQPDPSRYALQIVACENV